MSRRLSPFALGRVRGIVRNEGFGRVEAHHLLRQPRHGILSENSATANSPVLTSTQASPQHSPSLCTAAR